jgi:hypothetical protein
MCEWQKCVGCDVAPEASRRQPRLDRVVRWGVKKRFIPATRLRVLPDISRCAAMPRASRMCMCAPSCAAVSARRAARGTAPCGDHAAPDTRAMRVRHTCDSRWWNRECALCACVDTCACVRACIGAGGFALDRLEVNEADLQGTMQHVACSMQHATCNDTVQQCNMQHAACNDTVQQCNMQHATCNDTVQQCNMQHATCNDTVQQRNRSCCTQSRLSAQLSASTLPFRPTAALRAGPRAPTPRRLSTVRPRS